MTADLSSALFSARSIMSSMSGALAAGAPAVDGERTMAGVWSTPLPTIFREEEGAEGLCFTSEQGDLQVTLEKDRPRRVTLSSSGGGAAVSGNANFDFTHIHWDTGAVWSKGDPEAYARSRTFGDSDAPAVQQHLFSDRQVNAIIDQLNLAVDIPLLGEGTERKIFAGLVEQLNPLMKPALASCMPAELAGAIAVLMDETKAHAEKHEHVRGVLKSMIKEPLVANLHTQIDTAIPDKFELQVLKKAVGVMIRQMVERMVIGLEKSGFVSCE